MSRRTLQRHKVLGRPAQVLKGRFSPAHPDYGSGCQGDKNRFQTTIPRSKVLGTGQWLGRGLGIGEVVTKPRKKG